MTRELENKLAEQFPFMRCERNYEEQKANGRITDLYEAFGCEVRDGWYSILYGMCMEITAAYEKAGVPIDIKPVQVKEKFGEFRFYFDFTDQAPKTIHAVDFMGSGTIRFNCNDTPLHKEITEIVSKWEEKSTTICEECGRPGELRTDLRWVLTLCDDCYKRRST